ncbi:hypothetical protein BCR34DRAFT_328020 [Clohesyomyces aquaticus]|uniref:RlpA-like double-psi beta-barrel-protein domain-containing protein-containing protein n=1 Tax=Clohesyomyces aquaticus TaxID=1231657 RepID=A0A1Y1ZM98_9PLEO|nr:hypothetical protein BCR34DRAFT_328020 [Clohesyomyces aquaticus]
MSAPIEIARKPLPAQTKGDPLQAQSKEENPPPQYEGLEEGTTEKKSRLHVGGAPTRWAITDRFDRVLPPHKRYFGRSRRTLLIALAVIFLLIMGLIIGLAVGLTKRSKTRFIPLPGGAQTFTGDLTYYAPALGACGITSNDNSAICAISHYTFDAAQTGTDPNQNPLCGKKIRAQRVKDGRSVSVDLTVVDRCEYSLDILYFYARYISIGTARTPRRSFNTS